MMRLVIVGVDGSETAAKAAETAIFLAAETGAALHVVSAYDRLEVTEVAGVGDDHWLLSTEAEASATAERTAVRARRRVGTVTTAAVSGKPADALTGEADRLGADLIVVGNKRVQGITRVLGSVATSVAHHAPCDVYIAHTVGT